MGEASFNLAEAVVSVDIDVRFAETDAMGVVHHAAYIVWFEVGRVAWMKAAGVPYTEVAASGHNLAVTGVQATLRASASFGDTVRLVTCLTKLRSRQVSFAYEIYHQKGDELLVTGSTDHICVDDDGRMAKLPPAIFDRLQQGAHKLLKP